MLVAKEGESVRCSAYLVRKEVVHRNPGVVGETRRETEVWWTGMGPSTRSFAVWLSWPESAKA